MEPLEETHPSFQTHSFASTSFKNSIVDHTPSLSRKLGLKLKHSNSPDSDCKGLISSRGYSFLTPRTQISSLSVGLGEVHSFNEIQNACKNGSYSIDSVTLEATFDEQGKDIPTLKWCCFCKREVVTEVFYKNSSKTFWSALGIFLSGGICGCFMMPYMIDSCKDMSWRCFKCKRELNENN